MGMGAIGKCQSLLLAVESTTRAKKQEASICGIVDFYSFFSAPLWRLHSIRHQLVLQYTNQNPEPRFPMTLCLSFEERPRFQPSRDRGRNNQVQI
ncbi:unnamed protein product [Linum trigynum]|uniref:Uncharacterized protein n=1 Tax=Linum trigynum TaxID=586398 RepID=A0AAV2EBU8_9ROSI